MKSTKQILLVVLLVVLLLFTGIALKVILFPVAVIDKSLDMPYEIVDKTLNGDNAIKNYEWFKEQEAHIRTCLTNEEIAKEEWELFKSELPEDRTKWDREDKQEESSLRNSYYALEKLTNLAMEQYNAKSEMTNRNIFKDNLPSNMTRAWYAGKKLTN